MSWHANAQRTLKHCELVTDDNRMFARDAQGNECGGMTLHLPEEIEAEITAGLEEGKPSKIVGDR